jgi:transposase
MQQIYTISNIGHKLNRISTAPYGAVAKNASETAKHRQTVLKRFHFLQSKGLNTKDIIQVLGISRATIYRWQARNKHGFECLKPRSTKPKYFRKPAWSSELIIAVERMRKKYPLFGKAKIQVMLAREGIIATISTIGRIISNLIKRGSILAVVALKGQYSKKKRRKFDKHATRIPKGMISRSVGELVQIDHMTTKVGDKTVKHFNAWDRYSKWNAADIYSNATSYCAKKFLEKLLKESPFKIKSIQVDGGSEFMKEFEQSCEEHGIPLFVLPPRSPELNGGVERINRTWREEFYDYYDDLPTNLLELASFVKKYQDFYNKVRPHESLDYSTPLCYVNTWLLDENESHMS